MIDRLADCSDAIEAAGELLINTLKQGGKILLCGNGGSAADCQHIAAEFVVRYEKKRKALAAIALTTDSSILTAHANDFDFETVFSRQVEAIANEQGLFNCYFHIREKQKYIKSGGSRKVERHDCYWINRA